MTLSTRAREESGFGLVELLIAMTVMVVGITAIVAALSSGISRSSAPGTSPPRPPLADKQMEGYRKFRIRCDLPRLRHVPASA